MKGVQRIRFKRRELFMLTPDVWGAPIMERSDDHITFTPSWAHLMPSGNVMQNGQHIGTKDDIVVLEAAE